MLPKMFRPAWQMEYLDPDGWVRDILNKRPLHRAIPMTFGADHMRRRTEGCGVSTSLLDMAFPGALDPKAQRFHAGA